MLVVNRFLIGEPAGRDGPPAPVGPNAGHAEFLPQAQAALHALAQCPGFVKGTLSRAFDDPSYWCLITEWESVGAYRRALGGFDVKVTATPLLAQSIDEPSAYEELAAVHPGGEVSAMVSDRTAAGARRAEPAG